MKQSSGFTILEVLVVIAVSGFIFVSTMAAIQGRQQQVAYGQSTREFESKLNDVINDVTTGYFPQNASLSCQISASGTLEVIKASEAQNIGSDNVCLHIGKVVQFRPRLSGSQAEDKMLVYSIVGRRFKDTNSNPATTLAEAQPKVTELADPTVGTVVEEYDLPYGLRVTRVFTPDVEPELDYGMVAFMSSLSGGFSNSQQLHIGGVFGSGYNTIKSDAVSLLNKLTDDPGEVGREGYFARNPETGIVVCLEDSDQKKASITLGVRGSNETRLDLDSYNRGCNS